MPTYSLTAINVGGFPLGESDKVVTMFSGERGLVRAVAKGAKKPGTKMSGKAELLCVNKLLVATGRSLDIITQGESLETFRKLRTDLTRLSFGLYYAELTSAFGEGLEEECELYFRVLFAALQLQEHAIADARLLSLEFEMFLLRQLGVSPELSVCVRCRRPLTEYNITAFYSGLGGICCNQCGRTARNKNMVAESALSGHSGRSYQSDDSQSDEYDERGTFVTPLVWKMLVSADVASQDLIDAENPSDIERRDYSEAQSPALDAAHRLMQRYLEDRAGKRMRALDLLKHFES